MKPAREYAFDVVKSMRKQWNAEWCTAQAVCKPKTGVK